jgi:hypothetical protein
MQIQPGEGKNRGKIEDDIPPEDTLETVRL